MTVKQFIYCCLAVIGLLLFSPSFIQSQTIHWQDYPDKTFVFEINNNEAERLLKSNPEDSLILQMLHSPVASFTKQWEKPPKQGHFIFVDINKNRAYYRYKPILPFQVFLFKEYGVLTLQVIDTEGNVRKDAKVKIKGKWRLWDTEVHFDKESNTYTIDDASGNTNRLLTIELDKFKAVFNLEKHLVHPWYKDDSRLGTSSEFYSYMITDKNKYRPGETIRFKSYALSAHKRPLKEDLTVWMLMPNYNYKKITTLSPYHPGGFAGEIQLHDSLKLQLDQPYQLQLRNKKGRVIANVSFQYEDYELFDNKLEVNLKSRTHYYPDTNQIIIKALDANGLPLQNVKADILIKRRSVSKAYTDILILPDTLMYERIDLNNDSSTTVNIPADILGEADGTYEARVELITFDGQRMLRTDMVPFYRSYYDVQYDTRNDTIRFTFYEQGKAQKAKAKLRYNNSEEKEIELPYEEPFNQTIHSYDLEIPQYNIRKSFQTGTLYPGLDITGGIQSDSFHVQLVNPLQLNVSWYIYQGNILLQKGFGKEFDFNYPNTDLDVTHYVEIFYVMGDKENVYRRAFIPKSEYLSIETNLPERAYPGQSLDVNIQVKDYAGKPVKDADLTAFAVNTLLNYNVPDLPYYGTAPRTREQRADYAIHKKNYFLSTPLNYSFWNKIARLDEIEYYRFTYPGKNMFIHTVNTPDATTQFAPFVMKDGEAVDIYVIETNGRPVYFSWTGALKGYSFLVSDTGKQQISLRLHDRVIILDSLQFESGKKTILSIDVAHYSKGVRAVKLFNTDAYKHYSFTSQEINSFKNYISRIPVVQNNYVYLQQGQTVYPVYHPCLSEYKPNVLVGPVLPGKTTYMNWITYRHEGGFSYQFEDNVVYKYPETTYYPGLLSFSSSNNFDRLNDFYLSPKVMDQLMEACESNKSNWRPNNIQIAQQEINVVCRLPEEKEASGVYNLLFRNKETQQILSPDRLENGIRQYPEIPESIYDIILLYNNGNYLLAENIPVKKNTYVEVNMRSLKVYEPDSLSEKWLHLYISPKNRRDHIIHFAESIINRKGGNTVEGIVYASTGEPLAGVYIALEGTTTGTLTDIDGHFEIETDNAHRTLTFSYIGYKKKELDIAPDTKLTVILEEEQMQLDEVVVVGYGTSRKNALLGSVFSADMKESPQPPPENIEDTDSETKEAEDRLYSELLQLNGLRSDFSDVGFWEPRLYTDEKGKAAFSVILPDNITQWDATVYAMNRKLKTGTARKYIQSYKPLMAELKTPRFLVEGDTAYFVGTIRNYTHDKEISGTISFVSQQDTFLNKQIGFTSSYQEYIPVTAYHTDSITSTWQFTRNDGYTDGEKHSISIEKQGTEIAEGNLRFLRNGDKLTVSADKGEKIQISLTGKQLDVYIDAVSYLTGYKYDCNEQLASKLMGLLNNKLYQQYLNKIFKYDKNIYEIIKRLTENQNKDKLWSWFGHSSTTTSYWMSAHILKALKMAKDAGYPVNLNISRIEEDYMDTQSYRRKSLSDIEILQALSEWGTKQNYGATVKMFEEMIHKQEAYEDSVAHANKTIRQRSYLKEKLLLWDIRQKQQLDYVSDSISHYLKKDIVGAIYCDDGIQRDWYSDNMITTLIAYRIIKEDSLLQAMKEPVRMYILGTKQQGWNTYQASSAVSTLLPDLLAESSGKDVPATVVLSGKEYKEVTRFPFDTTVVAGESLDIEKIDGMPLIYSAYRTTSVFEEKTGDAFDVSSTLSCGDTIVSGQPVTLSVEVKVKQKNAEHVMIEVPIPSGCSYVSKPQSYNGGEVHREYFKEKVIIFCERLSEGTYTFTIPLLPRYSGKYILNPAKVELMYFPVINANNRLRKITINR
ncbi:MAG: carboxypeptidase-like regulatory domain-containing protein [Tannerellaceae bacterium]|jgi:hypothetical protein|nr:carboxypeptidase-like regulatory domain-containing protein [Tannerellaceae bacterium]